MTGNDFDIEVPPGDGSLPGGVRYVLHDPAGARLYASGYLRAALASTVVVFDRARERYLLITRGNDPYRGWLAFPGGFIETGREDLFETAIREVFEETAVTIKREDLALVDVRSDPRRDPRDHVVDVGFYAEVENAEPAAGDDAASVHWLTADELDTAKMAFDMTEFWQHVKQFKNKMSAARKEP
jgi:8-oxo-dGTP diphosphatase